MQSLHYALATKKAYRYWIFEFLRFHRAGDEWRHPIALPVTIASPESVRRSYVFTVAAMVLVFAPNGAPPLPRPEEPQAPPAPPTGES